MDTPHEVLGVTALIKKFLAKLCTKNILNNRRREKWIFPVKGKVVPVLNLIKHYAMKAYGGVDV
jgi:hypothetical protein